MNPATISAAIASSEKNYTALVSRAASLAGNVPAEGEAWALVRNAQHDINNLRTLLATADQGDPE